MILILMEIFGYEDHYYFNYCPTTCLMSWTLHMVRWWSFVDAKKAFEEIIFVIVWCGMNLKTCFILFSVATWNSLISNFTLLQNLAFRFFISRSFATSLQIEAQFNDAIVLFIENDQDLNF